MLHATLIRRLAIVATITAAAAVSGGATWAASGQPPSPAASSSAAPDDQALRSAKSATPRPAASGPATGGILGDPRAAGIVATYLGVTPDAAATALRALVPPTGAKGGLDPRSAGFGSAAQGLGVTPERLAQAIDDLKRSLG